MKTKIKWRLANRPTPSEVIDLNNSGLLTKDEAREILLTEENDEDRDKESLKSEIKFLRELVDKMAKGNQSKIVETIRYVERPYRTWPWYGGYEVWCGGLSNATAGSLVGTGTTTLNASGTNTFSAINTF